MSISIPTRNQLPARLNKGDFQRSFKWNKVQWDENNPFGEKLSAGIYIYQLRAEKFVENHKMIILK